MTMTKRFRGSSGKQRPGAGERRLSKGCAFLKIPASAATKSSALSHPLPPPGPAMLAPHRKGSLGWLMGPPHSSVLEILLRGLLKSEI